MFHHGNLNGSDEKITAPTMCDYKLNPQLSYFGTKTKVDKR